jgi:hypothetical protein
VPSQLTRSVGKTVTEADRISEAFARELATVLRDVEGEIRRLLIRIDAESAQARAAQALRARNEIRAMLLQSGYGVLVEEATGGGFDRMTARVLTTRRVAQVASELGPETRLLLEAMRTLHFQDLLEEGEMVTNAITRAVTRGMLGGTPVPVLLEEVARTLDTSRARVATLYDTMVSIYGRQVEAMQAGDDPQAAFLYAGPVDSKTRPFCLSRVGKVYTRVEIDGMDNGQISNVMLTGGGYNCRHVFTEISVFSELYPLRDTGERAPEIQEQVNRVRKKAA